MRRKDLLWILAYPVYQLIGSARHEASPALVVDQLHRQWHHLTPGQLGL